MFMGEQFPGCMPGTESYVARGVRERLRKAASQLMNSTAWLAVLPFLVTGPLSAQQPGDTVRVSGNLVGEVLEADSTGLLLSGGYTPYAGMRSLELWGGTTKLARRGFRYGLVAGGVLGSTVIVAGVMMGGSETTSSDYFKLVGVGGLVSLFCGWIGALIGSGIEREVWVPVPVPVGLSLLLRTR